MRVVDQQVATGWWRFHFVSKQTLDKDKQQTSLPLPPLTKQKKARKIQTFSQFLNESLSLSLSLFIFLIHSFIHLFIRS